MMNEMGIYANLSGHDKGYSSYKGKVGKTAPNLLKRDFNAEHSLEKAGTDVTEFKFEWSKVYLSPIIDFYNDEILGYALSLSPNMKMINDMLDDMYSKHPLTYNMMLHSDQGWQYQMESYQENLKVSWHHPVHVQKGHLPGQQQDREFLFEAEEGTFLRT